MKMLVYIAAFIIMIPIIRFLDKKFPEFSRKIELPSNIALTIIVAIYCGLLAYGAYDVCISSVSKGDKVFFVIFIAINISIFIAMTAFSWKSWYKKVKRGGK